MFEAEVKETHPANLIAALPVPPLPYATEVAEGVGDHQALLDHLLARRSERWSVERMPAVDRALLRVATYELAFCPAQPTAVVLSEAVELAKRFSTDDSARFVNGILASVADDVREAGSSTSHYARPEVLIVDIDGVVRHWNEGELETAATSLGLEPDALSNIAFDEARLHRVLVGALDDESWRLEVGAEAASRFGVDPAQVATLWSGIGWTVDEAVVDLVRGVRAAGARTACFSNASTRLEVDLDSAGLTGPDGVFDVVVNSARIGLAKPDVAAYVACAREVGADPGACLFVDDRPANVEGAMAAGMPAVAFQGVERLQATLVRVGLLPG